MRNLATKYIIPALLLEAGYARLMLLGALEQHIVETITILLLSSAVYLISAGLILDDFKSGKSQKTKYLTYWLIAAGIIFRLTVWPLDPAFTDDVLRYRWESRLQMEGGNPYEVAPTDPQWSRLHDETFARISGPEFRAVYGPFTELVYRYSYQVLRPLVGPEPRREIFWMKLPSVLFELGTIAGILALLRAKNLPSERVLLYVWCPLPVFEFWANGHNDPLVLCPLIFALAVATRKQWSRAFVLLGIAVSAKVWPLSLVPAFTGRRFERWKHCLLLGAVILVCAAPFGRGLAGNAPFLSGFLGGWRNNDSLYGILLWLWGDQYRAKYCAFALVALVAGYTTLRAWSLTSATLATTTAMLLVSANCHPWYLSWLVILLPVHPSLSLLAWTALVPIAYRVLPAWEILGEWNGVDPLRWWIYGPVFALFLYEMGRKYFFQKK